MLNLSTVAEGLVVTLHEAGRAPRTHGVESLAQASEFVRSFQDSNAFGASDLGSRHGFVTLNGEPCARVSYNGRVWRAGRAWRMGAEVV